MQPRKTARISILLALTLAASALFLLHPAAPQADTVVTAVSPLAAQTLARLRSAAGVQITAHSSPRTGVYDFVRNAREHFSRILEVEAIGREALP